jgi:hypothetical protein
MIQQKPEQIKNNKMKHLNNLIKSLALLLLIVSSMTSRAQTQAVLRSYNAENKVAVLPITYVGEGNEIKLDEMRYRLQNIAHDYLRSDAMELKFQDPSETNALLRKNGVTESNFRDFTPKELAGILHVEYVLMGIVSQDFVAEATVTHTRRRDEDHYRNRHWHGRERHGRERQTNSRTRTSQELATHIDLDIYNDKGENIYSKSRRSILSGVDAYKYGIQYLLKRSPIYKR